MTNVTTENPFSSGEPAVSSTESTGDIKTANPFSATTLPVKTQMLPAQAVAKKPTAQPSALSSAPLDPGASAVMRGLTFGLSDKLGSLAMSYKQGRPYEDVLKDQLAARDAYAKEHPALNIGSELFGGLLSGAPAVGAAKAVGKAVLPGLADAAANSALVRGGLTLGGGAAAGAVNGAGQAAPGQASQGAANGATIGAAVGGGLGALGAVGGYVGHKLAPTMYSVGKWFGLTNPDEWAGKAIQKSLTNDNTNLPEYVASLKNMAGDGIAKPTGQPAPDPGIMAMDNAGNSLGSKVQKALSRDTQAKQQLQQRMESMASDSPNRVEDIIKSTVSPRLDARTAMNDLTSQYQDAAKPFYDQARSQGKLDSPELLDWFTSSPARMRQLNDWRNLKLQNGDNSGPKLHYDQTGNVAGWRSPPTVDDAMAIKDYMGKLRDSMWDNGKGASNPEYGYLTDNVKSYRDLLDTLTSPSGESQDSPLFKARALTGEKFDVQRALETGMQFKTMPKDALNDTWNNLGSDAERDAFRIGAAQSLAQGSSGRLDESMGSRVNMLSGNKNMRDKLDTILPDDATRDYFNQMIGTEGKLADSYSRFNPSNYVSNPSEEAGIPSLMQVAGGLMTGNLKAAGAGLRGMGREANIGMADDQAQALLTRMMSSPDEFQQYADQLANKSNGLGSQIQGGLSAVSNAAPVSLGGLSGGAAGSSSGQPVGPLKFLGAEQ